MGLSVDRRDDAAAPSVRPARRRSAGLRPILLKALAWRAEASPSSCKVFQGVPRPAVTRQRATRRQRPPTMQPQAAPARVGAHRGCGCVQQAGWLPRRRPSAGAAPGDPAGKGRGIVAARAAGQDPSGGAVPHCAPDIGQQHLARRSRSTAASQRGPGRRRGAQPAARAAPPPAHAQGAAAEGNWRRGRRDSARRQRQHHAAVPSAGGIARDPGLGRNGAGIGAHLRQPLASARAVHWRARP